MGKENLYLTKFENRMVKAMLRLNPNWDESEVRKIVKYKMEKDVDTPSVELDNNYTHQHKDDVSLLSVFDWILDKKPIITGNGTFYHNQEEAINPVAQMLQDMLAERKAIKRKMFNSPEGSQEYIDLDRAQKNVKINVNS